MATNEDPSIKELAADTTKIPTDPNLEENLPAPNTVPDSVPTPVRHPLDPLNADEISLTTRLLQEAGKFQTHMHITTIILNESEDKSYVINYQQNDSLKRHTTTVIRDPKDRKTYRAVVDLIKQSIESFIECKDKQPGMRIVELITAHQTIRKSEALLNALAKRNINIDQVVFCPFSPGYRDENDSSAKRRLYRGYAAWRQWTGDNYYAHPIDGLVITVDLDFYNVEVEDYMHIPVPQRSGNYDAEGITSPNNIPYFPHGFRKDLKPLLITQPQGPSFQIDGYEITWQKWRFRVGLNIREGLTINLVHYYDEGRWRPILYRAAISEIWVPYGDSSPAHSFKNAYDVGENGLGILMNSLVLGCDCLGEIRYLDAVFNNTKGEPVLLKNAICVHEEDIGILWKHTEYIWQRTECRRSRRLVVSCMTTEGNYEYGFFWYFQQDGTIQFEVKLTGIIAPGAIEPGKIPKYGGLVAEGVYGPNHQHFFNMRIDWMLEGEKNSLVEINCEPVPYGEDNPAGNAWVAQETLFKFVSEARRQHDVEKGRYWKVINSQVKNHVNQPVGYKIVPCGPPCFPLCDINSPQGGRSKFARCHLWATTYHPDELYAAGLFPYQSNGGDDGVAIYSEKHRDESLNQCDLVTWYTFGCTHVVRTEDWPVMPIETVGFRLVPVGYFSGNPGIDVPPTEKSCSSASMCSNRPS